MMGMPALAVRNLSKSFGGVKAIRDVTLTIDSGRSKVLIGPNGAGKSTLFHLITGEIPMDSGEIYLFGTNVTAFPVRKRSELGLARTYQISNLFKELTVAENLHLALRGGEWESTGLRSIFTPWSKNKRRSERVYAIAGSIALADKLHVPVGSLSHGQQRQLELGIALAPDPKIILLDEPMAGLSPTERVFMKKLIRQLADEKMILAIEHDMDFALSLTRDVTVLHQGAVVVEGSPEEIKQNDKVKRIYKLQ